MQEYMPGNYLASMSVLTDILNRPTKARGRLEAMGFKFDNVTARFSEWGEYIDVRGSFLCICGRREQFLLTLPKQEFDYMDWCPVAMVERTDAFSAEHLRDDGYTEEQIADIMRRADEYEAKGDNHADSC